MVQQFHPNEIDAVFIVSLLIKVKMRNNTHIQ